MWIYLNDRFVKQEDALVSVFDHGFLYGDGVYETLRSYGPHIFLLDEHLARLHRSAELVHLQIPIRTSAWPDLLREAMTRNDVGLPTQDAYLRITVSRGTGDIGLDPALCPTPTVVIMAKPLIRPPDTLYQHGIALVIAHTRRNHPAALNPQIKSLNFLNNVLAKQEGIRAGVYDAIMLNTQGHLAECTISNLFFVQQGRLCTPSIDCGILDGLTRDLVLRLARDERLSIEEGHFPASVLQEASECFVTNTSSEVLPVSTIDGKPVGNGRPGALTERLRRLFKTYVASLH